MKMDLTIVSGARPELLSNTLHSLSKYIVPTFDMGDVFANVDQFGGGQAEALECKQIIEHYFPNAKIFMPQVNDFTVAVKTLWQLPTSKYFLHIEDDWEFLANINPREVEALFKGNVSQVTIDNSDKNRPILWRVHRKSIFTLWRLSIPDLRRPIFTTSPSFVDSSFGRQVAEKMKLEFDPEKQLYSDANQELSAFTKSFRNVFLFPRNGYYIRDTGRSWRTNRGIKKAFIDGKSVWDFGEK